MKRAYIKNVVGNSWDAYKIQINPASTVKIKILKSKKKYILEEFYFQVDNKDLDCNYYLEIDNFKENIAGVVITDKRAFGLYIPFSSLYLIVKNNDPFQPQYLRGFIKYFDEEIKKEK
jgi:hypothetical protein